MARKMNLGGKTAIITGAASGIGRGIALALARRGSHLALADVNDAALAETVRLVRQAGARVAAPAESSTPQIRITQHHLDVSDAAAIAAFPETVLVAHPTIDILVNNAGVALGGTFEQTSEADFDWLLAINLMGVIRMTRAFLPVLRKSGDARLVNLSSIFGVISPPGQTAYTTSKFGVRGFSNALRLELRGSGVGVTVVHPGGIATNIARNARIASGIPPEDQARQAAAAQKALRMPPEQAGEIIVQGIERRADRIIVGNDARFIVLLERLAPVRHWQILQKLLPKP
jgi:NAD(P)-dependent dehydrogenase (short-subunit alcohol dehydrogenase family)